MIEPDLISRLQACRILKCGYKAFHALVDQGRIRVRVIPNVRPRYLAVDVQALVEAATPNPNPVGAAGPDSQNKTTAYRAGTRQTVASVGA